jgi:benzoyl-CoA reductase subunit C
VNFESIVVKADVQSKDLIKEVERGLGGKAIKLAEELHERGKKIFGLISWNIPEEVIYAAGVIPFRLFGEAQLIEKAHAYLPSWSCSFSRRCLEMALNDKYNWLDGLVASKLEDTCIALFYLLKHRLKPKFSYLLQVPVLKNELCKEYFAKEILDLKCRMEKFLRRAVSDDDLKRAIRVYNENRRLLRMLYEARKEEDFPLSGADVLKIVISSMTTPKEEHSENVKKILEGIDTLKSKREREKGVEKKVKVHVSGTELTDPEVLQIIEGCGTKIVSDDLNTGTAYFWNEVDESKDPYDALAEHYLIKGMPNLLMSRQLSRAIDERIEYIRSLVEEFEANGVVFLVDRGCEVMGFAYPHLRDGLRKHNIPFVRLDLDYPFPREQYVTRIKAFIEMVRERGS